MKAIIYTTNSNTQTLSPNNTISLGTVNRRCGCGVSLTGSAITIDGIGFYTINGTITGTATADGSIAVTVYKDGVAIPGATATATVTAGDLVTLPVIAVTRETCPCCDVPSAITFVWTGAAGTVSNISTMVEKI